MTPQDILKQFFGYDKFKSGQKEIISSILSGQNILAILPTGGGKSLCYQIPALICPTFSIVISPLIALMKDQVDSINKREKIAAYINSTLDYRESEKVLQDVAENRIKLLYLSPEKLDNKQFAERISLLKPYYIFVDEAHCISEWGHNFRPSYRKIKQFIEYTGIDKISAFTATATEDVRSDIVDQLGMKNPKIFVRGFERENLHINVVPTKQKKEFIAKILKSDSMPAIIYTATRKLTEEVTEYLRTCNIDAAYYHAGLTSDLRKIIQDDFLNGRIKVIVSTNAFGMGIDKSDIRTVIHYSIPGNLENYYQEIGRAGRDGLESDIFLLYEDKDRLIQEYFINNSFPTKEQIELTYNAVCDYGKVALGNLTSNEIPIDLNLISFLESKDISKAITEASIRILEESDYIKANSEFNKKHSIKFLIDTKRLESTIKEIDNNELKDLIFLLVKKTDLNNFNKKSHVDISAIASLLNANPKEIIQDLKTLNESGILEYHEPSRFPTVVLSTPRIKIEQLKLDYKKQFDLQKHSRNKLDQMLEFTSTQMCRFRFILNYFGQSDNTYKCGKCDNCTGTKFSGESTDYIEDHILQTLNESGTDFRPKELFDILLGRDNKSNFKFVSTFGSCELLSKNELESALTKLSTKNEITIENGIVRLIHKGPITIQSSTSSVNSSTDYETELKLFNLLRQIRSEAAKKFGQPASMICPDETLREIAHSHPSSYSELMEIKGFNQRMYNKIGEEILSVIKDSVDSDLINKKLKEKNIPQNVIKILELVQKKYSLSDISSLTKLPESVVSIQIETLLGIVPELEVDSLFDKDELNEINQKINEGISDLKMLRESLNGKISYAKIRIALSKSIVT